MAERWSVPVFIGAAQCGASEVLGSSGVRIMRLKNRMYKNRIVCEREILKILVKCSVLISDLIIDI